jgi:hypothetical protein
MLQVPVACTLSADELGERLEEWRTFFATSIESAEMVGTDNLRLHLKRGPEVLAVAVDLAQREKACCAFFDFSIGIETDACWMVVGVPEEAAEILSNFARLLPGGAAES